MDIEKVIKELTIKGWFVDFEMDADFSFTCFIKDGYYMEDITRSFMGEGKTLSKSLQDAIGKFK